ncbi:hypothetical protein ACJMK2_032061 [Sinanodonta woodiana]|uniref:C-type lectin domain-containing protein n=1 Tax=Sinanodonta woodiana TaxID=1069815 RepID=A0ABD3X4J0_SINWO
MKTIIQFVVLVVLHQLLARDAYAADGEATDRSVKMFLGDSVCQRSIQEDIKSEMDDTCTVKGDNQYAILARKLDALNKNISDLSLKLSTKPEPVPGVCPRGYVYYQPERFCYQFHGDCKSWPQARQICLQEGADLISLKESNFNFFMDLARSTTSECSSVWVGTTDVASEGQWSWLNGVRVTASFWAPGQPDNWANKENCGDLAGFFDYKLNDEDCRTKLRYICSV